MSVIQFFVAQLFFFLSFTAITSVLFSLPEPFSYYLPNIVLFFGGSWLLSIYLRQKSPYVDVLSVTLSFNLVTYLIFYLQNAPLPGWQEIGQDFILVSLFSLLGAFVGRNKQT